MTSLIEAWVPGMARERLDFRFEYAAPRLLEAERDSSHVPRDFISAKRAGE